jgi:hypothetical protein
MCAPTAMKLTVSLFLFIRSLQCPRAQTMQGKMTKDFVKKYTI